MFHSTRMGVAVMSLGLTRTFNQIFLTLVAAVLLGSVMNAQSVDSPEYQDAKSAGALVQQDLSLPVPHGGYENYLTAPVSSFTDPDCWIETEDSWSTLAANDDGSTGIINLPFTFDLYGQSYNSLYVNNNGNLTFNQSLSAYSPDGMPISIPMVAPFWGDVDTRFGLGTVSYFVGADYFVASWESVGVFPAGSDTDDLRNTFQVIITDGNSAMLSPGANVGFHYGTMDWTTGSASEGIDGFGGFPATVGINSGNNVDFIQVGRFDENTSAYDGAFGANDGVNWLENQCLEFNVSDGNEAPMAIAFPDGQSVSLCSGETSTFDVTFNGPEVGETVTIEVAGAGALNYEILSNTSGNEATISIEILSNPAGNYTLELLATDDNITPASTSFEIAVTVEDCGCTPSLEITCPADVTIACGDDDSPVNTGLLGTETSDCTADPEVTFTDTELSNDGCTIVLQRDFTAVAGDLVEMCTQLITLIDTEAPELIGFEAEIAVECLEDVPAPAEYEAIDACSGEAFDVEVFESNTGNQTAACDLETAFGPGDDWAFWLPAASANGQVSSANFNFDADGGLFQQFADGTARLTGTVVNDENANEKFELDLWFENKADWATWSSMGRSYKDDLGCAQPDLYESWTYYELVNGFSTATGLDGLAGDVLYLQHMPANYYFGFQIGLGANNKNCDYGLSGWFTYEGIVDGEYTEGHGDVNVNAECEDTPQTECIHDTDFTYLYRAADNCNNVVIAEQVITVQDNTPPTFVDFPEDLTVNCEDYPIEVPALTAIDNCVGDVTIQGPFENIIEGECPQSFEVQISWSATDVCDNQTNMTWTITVVDEEAPVLTIPADLTVECDAIPAAGVATATDNCSEEAEITIVLAEEIEQGDCTGNYWIYRTWTATDACGNSSAATQEIAVEDTTAPVFDAYEANVEMPCDDISYDIALTATDNCGTVEVAFEDEASDAGCAGTVLRTYTATDDCGNASSVLVTITLTDNVAPEFTALPNDMTVECDDLPAVATDAIDYTDNCTEVSLAYNGEEIEAGDCTGNYTIFRTWTITDACGNAASHTQTINVQDTTAPEFTFIPQDNEYSCEEEIPAINAEASDNCGTVEVTFQDIITPGDCPQAYTIERAFVATDDCGNASTASQFIYVYDETAPTFTFVQENLTLECDEEVPAPEATATDNCDEDVSIEVTSETTPGECPQEYVMVRTYVATDDCGNATSAQQTITVVDTTAPEFDAYDFQVYISCEEVDGYILSATDNCGDATVEITEEILQSGGCMGVLYREYTATDACGNSTTVGQYITITDTIAPELEGVPADATIECDEVNGADDGTLFGDGGVTGVDNCGLEVEVTYSEEIVDGECANAYTVIRTWVAVDYCENETMAQQTITVQDTTDPQWESFPADLTVECSDDVPAVEFPTATDNCDDAVLIEVTEETEAGDCPQEYTLLRIFRATDNCGNEIMAVQTIEVVDTTAPVFTFVPGQATFECDEDIALVMATADDNCSDAEVTYEDVDFLNGDCEDAYSFVRVFTATDACGNAATASQNIFVEDTTAPVIEAEPFLSMPCDMIDADSEATASDNCDADVELTWEDQLVSGGCAGNVLRTFTATDNCGNSTELTQVINLIDETAPVFTVFPMDMTVPCDDVPGVSENLEATDNCDDELLITYLGETTEAGDCLGNYTLIRTWTVIDGCGNMTEQSQTITVVDEVAPSFTSVPADVTYECDETIAVVLAVAEDNCGTVEVTYADEQLDGACPNAYTIVRTFTATDDCGNAATAEQLITVEDTTAPAFTFVPAGDVFECDEAIDYGAATASDNCGDVEISFTDETIAGDCENAYSIVRTWTATDACGNAATATTTYNVEDTTAPVIVAEAQLQMPCDDVDMNIFASATDNCDTDVEITYTDLEVSGGCAGNILRTYVATDNCGNASEFTQVINLIDEVAPELNGAPADQTIECDSEIPAPADVTATDNCDDELEVIFSETTEDNDCLYNIIRTWTVLDHCDNEASATQVITVVDTTAPAFTFVPADATVECDETVPAINAEAEDLCTGATVTWSDETFPGECPSEYTIVRTFIAVDGCGNAVSTSQTIEVVDTTAPTFTAVPAGGEFECDEDIDFGMAAADDNCSDATVTFEDFMFDGDCENAFSIERVWTAVDACGNTATANTWYYVYDATAPVIVAEANLDMPCDDVDMAIFASATDNCDTDVEITYTDLEVSGGCAGNILRTYVATDNCGNTSEYTQVIHLIDEVAPELNGVPADIMVECGDEIPAPAQVGASDNCDDALEVIFSENTEDLDCLYSIVRTWTVTDHCDNTTTASQVITLVDTTAPALSIAADATVECDEALPAPAWEASDICDESLLEEITEEVIPGACANEYTLVRTYRVTDDCGNSTALQQTINVVDTTAPEFTFVPSDNEYACDADFDFGMATATDNCGDAEVTFSDETIAGECANAYTIVRTWTATDACGNATSASTSFFFYDDQAPEFDQEVEDVVAECAGDVPANPVLTATDNCGDATVTSSTDIIDEDDCGNYIAVVTYTATDACGNVATTSFQISVIDETAPELSETPENLVLDCDADVPPAAEVFATDNCDDVTVVYSEEIIGDMPAEGSDQDCLAFTGESPFYNPAWSLWLQNFPGADEFYTTVSANFVSYPDGSAVITGEVESTSTEGGWTFTLTLENGLDWEAWSTQGFPTNYKDDFNVAGDNYLDWNYYLIVAGQSTLYGTGIYAGSVIDLSHAPANYYYGYQVGIGANNVNGNYGSGGWFYYNGDLNGTPVNGAGDFAFDHDCCPRYEVVRTWTATDCSGNSVSHSQTISFEDLGDEPVADGNPSDNIADVKPEREQAHVHNIFPNPAVTKSMVEFNNERDGITTIEVYSLNGTRVLEVFNGKTAGGTAYRAEIDATFLSDGVYLVRFTHNGAVTTDRLIVGK